MERPSVPTAGTYSDATMLVVGRIDKAFLSGFMGYKVMKPLKNVLL
jgi:hypothetical protein